MVPDSEELCEIAASTDIGIAGSAEGTVFPTSIKQTKINSLFDTGATKSVMSGDMDKRLKLGPLDTKRLPKVVGADGTSLGAMGRISCEINIGTNIQTDFPSMPEHHKTSDTQQGLRKGQLCRSPLDGK